MRDAKFPLCEKAGLEAWKDIPDWPGYQASSMGRVRGSKTANPTKGNKTKYGYMRAKLWSGGKVFHRFVHRLVLDAFVGKCPEGMECSHKDGKRDNNALSNLEWATRKQNADMRKVHGTHPAGEKHPAARITAKDAEYIRNNFKRIDYHKSNSKELAKRFGISAAHVRQIASGKNWLAKGGGNG